MSFESGIFIFESMGISIALIDVIVVLFGLILMFAGMARGFVKVFFSLFGTLLVIVGSVLLAKTVGGWLTGGFGGFVQDPITNWMMNIDAEQDIKLFSTVVDWTNPENRANYIPVALSMLGLPATISGIITDTGMLDGMFESFGEAALIDVLPAGLTSIIMTIIAFILLLIILGIVMVIIKRALTNLTKFRLFGGINRLLGLILGLAQAYLIVSVILVAVSYIPTDGFLSVIHQQIDASCITKFLVQNNWIGNWLLSTIFPQ